MKIEKYLCDKCGTEVRVDREIVFGHDFCPVCITGLENVVSSWIGQPKEVIPKKIIHEDVDRQKIKGQRKRNRIDWDKACALKQGGWKHKDIADELGCGVTTIDTMIGKKFKAYLGGHRDGKAYRFEDSIEE